MDLKEINKKTAEDFFARYEHLGNCGLGVWHYGLYEQDELFSVISFGTTNFDPSRSRLGKLAQKFNLKIIQLNRGGTRFDAPRNTPSHAIRLAFNEIKKRFGECIVVAYSDTKWNEIGTIYQASNFLYLGLTNPKGQSNYLIKGKVYSGWTVRKKYGTRDMVKLIKILGKVKRISLTQKHIYIYLNMSKGKRTAVIKELDGCIMPYPKREALNVGSMLSIHKSLSKRIIVK